MKNYFNMRLCVNHCMLIKYRQWHFQRCLLALSAVFLGFTIFCSYALAQSNGPGSITGTVVDQKGNSVPGAFVELIMNGSIPKVANNPQLSGDGRTKPFGSFNFTGLASGEYTILAEITTPASGTLNGTVSVKIANNTVVSNVKLPKYVYTYSTPTPTPVPTPVATPQAVEADAGTITPSPVASESSATTGNRFSAIFNDRTALLMVGMFSLIIVGGVGVFTISRRSGQRDKHLYNNISEKDDSTINDPGHLSGAGAHRDIPGYEEDIACMMILKNEGKLSDTDYYRRVNAMAEKYKLDQSIILYDISKRMKTK